MKKIILVFVVCAVVVVVATTVLMFRPKPAVSPVVNNVPSPVSVADNPTPTPTSTTKRAPATPLTDYVIGIWSDTYSDQEHSSGKKPDPEFVIIADVIVDDCGPNPDGICGWPLYIVGSADWESNEGKQVFYLGQAAGSGLRADTYLYQDERLALTSHFGPFTDYLQDLVEQARTLKEIKVDPNLRQ